MGEELKSLEYKLQKHNPYPFYMESFLDLISELYHFAQNQFNKITF